jgi:hypothetical protein
MFSAQLTVCVHDLVRHFKTEPTETVALCFGYQKKPNQLILLDKEGMKVECIAYNNDYIPVYCIQQRLYTSVLYTTTMI